MKVVGRIILGVTDKVPRTVVGSQAFQDLERTKAGLIERLRLRVDAEEIQHPNGRVLVFQVPSRPIGMPIQYEGAYWMRGGEDLIPMTPDLLQRIFAEASPDFSAEVCALCSIRRSRSHRCGCPTPTLAAQVTRPRHRDPSCRAAPSGCGVGRRWPDNLRSAHPVRASAKPWEDILPKQK